MRANKRTPDKRNNGMTGMGIDRRLEEKLGFDKVRALLSDRCSTDYALQRIAEETFSTKATEIRKRLLLTDEMRLIAMFEETFPTTGYIDALPFLVPLEKDGSSIDLLIPGSPSRVSERIESCYDVIFSVASGRVDYNSERIQLWPVSEEFIENPLTEEQQGIIEDMQKKEANLSEILSTVMEGRLAEQFSNIDQIHKIPGFTDAQRKLAEEYYRKYSAV